MSDACLCHGWAGLLHVIGRIDADDPGCGLGGEIDRLARRTTAAFDPELPFGYRHFQGTAHGLMDDPALLTGSAGVALALHAYRNGRNGPRPASCWDAALLLD